MMLIHTGADPAGRGCHGIPSAGAIIVAALITLLLPSALHGEPPANPSEPASDAGKTWTDSTTGVRVDADYAGGNIVVERFDKGVIHLKPDLRDTTTWWFYWNFRVRGAEGQSWQFVFEGGQPIGVRGPAISTDRGVTWRWLGMQQSTTGTFSYDFKAGEKDVRFAFTIPYLPADWERFVRPRIGKPSVRLAVLCQSRAGRHVPCLHIGASQQAPTINVAVTCRHHACEAMADYVLEGLIDAVLEPRSQETRWLRAHARFLAVPMVDMDGVAEGDQGKNRRPRDHGRDYAGQSLYPETAALRQLVPGWSRSAPLIALDLHCPWIRGAHNEVIYMVGSSVKGIWREQQKFGAILEQVRAGPLPYRAKDNLPFGQSWNTAGNYKAGKSFSAWAAGLPNVRLSTGLEIPYANASGVEVVPESTRAFGRDLARAVGRYAMGASAGK